MPPIPTANVASVGGNKAVLALDYGKRISLNWLDQAHKALAKHSRDIHISSAEQDQLAAHGIHDPAVQKHFAWRRSLLWFITVPTIFAAVLGTINVFAEGFEQLSAFGVFMSLVYAGSMWAIPASTVLAARVWDQPRRSRRILLIGFLASFLIVVLMGVLPLKFWIKIEDPGDPQARQMIEQGVALVGGLYMMVLMLPAILSLLPGAIRACVRIKVLFPQSIVSGWLLSTVTLLYALFLLSLFILINQAAGNFLLIIGMAALVGAPLTYLVKTPIFIRPLWTDEDRQLIARAQWIYFAFLISSVVLPLIYAFSASFFGHALVGFASKIQ